MFVASLIFCHKRLGWPLKLEQETNSKTWNAKKWKLSAEKRLKCFKMRVFEATRKIQVFVHLWRL